METIFDCKFKPNDPNLLATASFDGTVKVWDVDTLTAVYTSPGNEGVIYSLSWAPGKEHVIQVGRTIQWPSDFYFPLSYLLPLNVVISQAPGRGPVGRTYLLGEFWGDFLSGLPAWTPVFLGPLVSRDQREKPRSVRLIGTHLI